MSKPELTIERVRDAVRDTVQDVIRDYAGDPDTDRATLIERLDEECDTLWGQLV
jgi:hypothetical protein